MGIFSFLKNAGEKVFGKEEEKNSTTASQPVQEVLNKQKAVLLTGRVQNLNVVVNDLSVDFDGETATVRGEVDSQSNKERIILTVGNVEGVGAVNDQMTVKVEEPEADFYEVKKGDTLSKIAKVYYKDAMKYLLIFEANTPMLKDPDLIYPGQVLRIPKIL